VRVLVARGFVERSRNRQGRQVLRPTSKGQQAVKQYLADLHRLSRAFALPAE
jgi:DNA-binding MarR family transcriptional regulator